jgi:hypothetical protein
LVEGGELLLETGQAFPDRADIPDHGQADHTIGLDFLFHVHFWRAGEGDLDFITRGE